MVVVLGFVEEAPAAQYYNSCAVFAGKRLVHLHCYPRSAPVGAPVG
jgi:hypothetical protein